MAVACNYNTVKLLMLLLVMLRFGLIVALSSSEQIGTSESALQRQQQHHQPQQRQKGRLLHIPLRPAHHVLMAAADAATADPDKGHGQRKRYTRTTTTAAKSPAAIHGYPQQVSAMYQGYGEHYIDLWCGSPEPQRQTALIHTGAIGTSFPCLKDCINPDECGGQFHTDPYYDETQSNTFHRLVCDECVLGGCKYGQCTYRMDYPEGSSFLAVECQDLCYLGGLHDQPVDVADADCLSNVNDASISIGNNEKNKCNHPHDLDPRHAAQLAFDLRFGCQMLITGFFQYQLADGILGMNNSPQAFWAQLYQAGKMVEPMFSLCYTRQPTAERNGTESGALTLGGTDDRLHLHPMVYTHHEKNWKPDFGVRMRKMHLRQGGGGDSAKSLVSNLTIITLNVSEEKLNHGHVVIESGTTDTYFSRHLFEPFQEVWRQLMGEMDYTNLPLNWSYEQIQTLPTILLQLQGAEELNREVSGDNPNDIVNLAGDLDPAHPYDVIIAIPPNHYMHLDNGFISRFYVEEPLGRTILGANAMMGHDILFDPANGRIGWAESNCDYRQVVADAQSQLVDNNNSSSISATTKHDATPEPSPTPPINNQSVNQVIQSTTSPAQGIGATVPTTSESANTSTGSAICSSYMCDFVVLLFLSGGISILLVVRQGSYGVWTERVRRATGRSEYTSMRSFRSTSLGGTNDGMTELELRPSSIYSR